MAGGIDWFRWHHGSVTDPKFQLVARRAGASLPDVLAVWAYLLEQSSAADVRGDFSIDDEAVDCMFGFPERRTADILAAMADRGLIDGSRIAAWEKRQPKRERPDDASAERTRTYRARQSKPEPCDATQNLVTPCDASERQETPRVEESREEKKEKEKPPKPPAPPSASLHRFPPGFETLWAEYPRKVGKDAAAKAFAKRRPDAALLLAMVKAVKSQRHSEQWRKDSGQYIPHLSTWLNEGRWQDEAGQPGMPASAWHETWPGVVNRGAALGMPWGELTPDGRAADRDRYKAAVMAAARESA